MIVSFSIDDLKHTVPGAVDLASMTGDELAANAGINGMTKPNATPRNPTLN